MKTRNRILIVLGTIVLLGLLIWGGIFVTKKVIAWNNNRAMMTVSATVPAAPTPVPPTNTPVPTPTCPPGSTDPNCAPSTFADVPARNIDDTCQQWQVVGDTLVWTGAVDGSQDICQSGIFLENVRDGTVTKVVFEMTVAFTMEICQGDVVGPTCHTFRDCDFSQEFKPGKYIVTVWPSPQGGFRARPVTRDQ